MRFFYAPIVSPLHELDPNESKHLVRVLRAQVGDEVGLVDGKGNRYRGNLTQVDKRACLLETSLVESQPEPTHSLTLVIAPTKSTDRFEWLLEKAMEYGVRRVQPIWTARSERKKEKTDRWEKILVNALKQSQQLWLTELASAVSWEVWLASEGAKGASGFIAHCEPAEKLHLFDAFPTDASSWVAIGPEGDFTTDEIALARSKGVQEVTLGDQRLRTETAGLAAIQMHALVQR